MTSTVCLVAKDEDRAIAEWLAYQFVIGFDQVVVFDNESSDNTADIIKSIVAQEPRLTYCFWPDVPGRRTQQSAYEVAAARCSTDWIAFFDTDEFFVPRKHGSVNEFLASLPAEASGVAINWLIFGSAGRIEAGDGLVIDRFTRCAASNQFRTRICKSFVRPKAVSDINVHTARLLTGYWVNSIGQKTEIENNAKTPQICHEGAQLNHYLLKSREEFELKKARGDAARVPEDRHKVNHRDEDFWKRNDLNQGEDREIMRWRPAVCAKLASWGFTS